MTVLMWASYIGDVQSIIESADIAHSRMLVLILGMF